MENPVKSCLSVVVTILCLFASVFEIPVDAGVPVRLVHGNSPNEGTVEVYYQCVWGTISSQPRWGIEEANVICRQLGYPSANQFWTGAHFGPGTGPVIFLNDVACDGHESNIAQCHPAEWFSARTSHSYDAGVTCTVASPSVVLVRLADGSNPYEGRVEVYYETQWGTVCDDGWSIEDANVICQQLGYPSAYQARTNAYFGQGSGPILLDNVACNGNELSIDQCDHGGWFNHSCSHRQDAGVVCGDDRSDTTSSPISVRLVNGNSPNEGTVEVYYQCFWGTICSDSNDWTLRDANVICRQLGYPSASQAWRNAHFGRGSGPTLLSNVACNGAESSIDQCEHSGWFNDHCGPFYDVGVTCDTDRCASDTSSDGLTWPVTIVGSTAESVERCELTTSNAGEPLAVRNCSIAEPPVYFQWEVHERRSCGQDRTGEITLEDVEEVKVSEGNAAEVAGFLANKTSESSENAKDVEVVSNILVNIVNAGSGDTEVTKLVVETVNNVIMNAETTPNTPDIDGGSSSAIIQSVETQVALTLQQEGHVSIQQDSIHVEAVSLDPMEASNGFSFVATRPTGQGSPQGQDDSLSGTEITVTFTDDVQEGIEVLASARLPGNIPNLIQSNNGNSSAQLQASFLIYVDDTLFKSALIREYRREKNSTREVAGSVVSLTVENVELVNLTEPAVLEFKTPVNATEEEIDSIQCVSWDFELEDDVGDWSTVGCVRAGVTNEKVSCNCSHATNFAILVDIKGQVSEDTPYTRALDIISQVGCVLSIIALAVTLIIYLSIRKLRTGGGISRQIFFHFCVSLLMLYIVFLAGVDNARGSGGGCVFVAALLHYLTLTTMMWMAVEARNMYVSTVNVFPEDASRYMLKASVIAWGSPLVVLTITLAAASDHYNNKHYCFLRPDLVLYIGLLVPIALILIHNIITFILVMRSLLGVQEVSRSQQITKRLQNAVGISALLGLTWSFGFLAISGATFAFQLIFCLANSLQGVLVFIMFCVRRDEVRTAIAPYLRRICCGHTCRLPSPRPAKSNDAEMVTALPPTFPSSVQTYNSTFDISITGNE